MPSLYSRPDVHVQEFTRPHVALRARVTELIQVVKLQGAPGAHVTATQSSRGFGDLRAVLQELATELIVKLRWLMRALRARR